MVFSSLEFLLLYLTVTLLLYFIVPLKLRNIVLLVVSLIFYGWGEPVYMFLMMFTITVDYIFGMLVEKSLLKNDRKHAKMYMIIAIVINLAILGFFKYFNFFIENLRLIPGLQFMQPIDGLALPIGISFYTFQALSYVIDVYRMDTPAQKNIASFGAYVTLYPQLIAGPIVRYKDVDDQLNEREHSVALFAEGTRTFIAGLCKKIFLANMVGQLWESFKAVPSNELTVVGAWFGMICYS
ncbi:MAG: MBOAT family protein, partial [Clostridia bacterium]|nr:MBOAT family protein [Clostridia bacterium]